MVIVILVVVGLALGSFVNALVWRIHAQEKIKSKGKLTAADQSKIRQLSIARGRSKCMHCGHELTAKDLIPVISWLRLRGKCRYCTARIPDTPVAELAVPLLFAASYVWWPLTLDSSIAWLVFAGWLAAVVCFVALTIYDFKWFILPDRVVYPLIGLALARTLLLIWQANAGDKAQVVLGAFLGIVIIAGLFYALYTLSQGKWIGGGDVKLGIALGLLAGDPFKALLVILLASVTGLIFMLPSMVSGEANRRTKLPFGPFLMLGTIIAVLFGTSLVNWYLGILTV